MSDSEVRGGRAERFRLNEPAVIADLVDGEAVIMNMERGSYYSLDETGSEVWRLLIAGVSAGEIADALAERYGVDRERASRDIGGFVAQIVEEDLVVALAEAARTPVAVSAQFSAAEYTLPALTAYSDMKDLLALDPPLPEFKPRLKE